MARADGSAAIGLGHAGRALAVAQELQRRTGARPVFLAHPDPLLERFLDGNVELRPVDEPGYGVRAVLAHVDSDSLLVSDSYDLDAADLARLRSTGCRHLVIDDFAQLDRWECDVVVNPNLGAATSAYDGVRALVGAGYALLRHEVLEAVALRGPARAEADRLLVCLGGGTWGPAGHVLLAEAGATGLDVRATTRESVPNGVAAVDPDTLPAQLAWADAAIISGGVVKYEAAAVGVPSVIVATVDHQDEVAKRFAEAGAAEYAGLLDDIRPENVVESVRSLLADDRRRQELSARARSVVDGRGAERAAAALLAVVHD